MRRRFAPPWGAWASECLFELKASDNLGPGIARSRFRFVILKLPIAIPKYEQNGPQNAYFEASEGLGLEMTRMGLRMVILRLPMT